MSHTTRRDFLATTSLAAVGSMLGARQVRAQCLPADAGLSPMPANAFLPEPTSPVDLRALVTTAVDAAKAAGASFADARVAERHWMELRLDTFTPIMPATRIQSTVNYGVRVIVDGTWAFVHGAAPTSEAVAEAARNAVRTAKGYAKRTKRRVELAPAPVVTGEWSTPFTIDPFSVPLQDQAALLGAFRAAGFRVRHGRDGKSGAMFRWTRETRAFASTDGSLVTQILRQSEPFAGGAGDLGMGDHGVGAIRFVLPRYNAVSGGYETVTTPGLQDQIKQLAEEGVWYAELPRRTLDVGRHPVVLDGISLAAAFGCTVGPALELDRVLGYEADASGTSYLSPSTEVLGTPIASALLNVTAGRALPAVSAVKWDDEGVESETYPILREGRLVDYHTSRQTAVALNEWYTQQGRPLRSHGCAVAPEAGYPVLVRSPHLSIAPGAQPAALRDLCKDVTRGVLVLGYSAFTTDQQLASTSLTPGWEFLLEIEKGKIVRRLDGNGLQFSTASFWKSLTALGDATTISDNSFELSKGQPWRRIRHSATAPAGLFKDVNVVRTKVRV